MIEEDIDIKNPKSYSYVFGGLKPLSVKFIETIFEKKGFKNIGSKCKLSCDDVCSDVVDTWAASVSRGRERVLRSKIREDVEA